MVRAAQGTFVFRTWGGRRAGAGRPSRSERRTVPHRRRIRHDPRLPVHVTLRAAAGVPSLRDGRAFDAVHRALTSVPGPSFRVLHFSVQHDHLHLLVEADRATGLARGCQGLAVRLAKAINRSFGARGTVWGDRYHARWLRTPREVRNALVYILQNFRKHIAGARGVDPRSSAAWFDGWRISAPRPPGPAPVRPPRTWLARIGWLRHGRIDVGEMPRPSCRPST
jgi:putative transposase